MSCETWLRITRENSRAEKIVSCEICPEDDGALFEGDPLGASEAGRQGFRALTVEIEPVEELSSQV